jgi:bacterioferritin (cytochrome b1)
MQRELVRNVGEINKSMSVVALAMIRQKLSDAEDKKYQLEDVLDDLDSISDEKKYQRTVKRLKDVQNDIDTYKLQIEDAEGTEARQLERQLDYQGDVGV